MTRPSAAAAASFLTFLAGCASIDGTYTPGCLSHAGNSITLKDGRFVWDKFTDQVLVNDRGEVVDQFPDYPVRGRYSIEGDTLHFDSYTGETLPAMHVRRDGDKPLLLTDEQLKGWPHDENLTRCALIPGVPPQ
jgi:hypothetical protein